MKLYGRVVDEQDPDVREAFREAIRTRIDWAPDEQNFHCYSVDVESAGFIRFGDDRLVLAWDPVGGLRRPPHPG